MVTGKQQSVLWLGLVLVALRFFTTGQFKTLWSIVLTPGSTAPANSTTSGYAPTGTVPAPNSPLQPVSV
jgi:hypothetical protein